MSARQGALITNSIRQMKNEEFTSHELTLDLLDQFIGPNGEEPNLLLSVGTSSKLITTDGYPPWVSYRFSQMYFLNISFSRTNSSRTYSQKIVETMSYKSTQYVLLEFVLGIEISSKIVI